MLEISPEKVAHVIVRAREFDAKVASWDEPSEDTGLNEDADSILEDHRYDATESEVSEFISNLNVDEQANLVAIAWIGRGTFSKNEFAEALAAAKAERTTPTERYLLGIPLLADYLEEGMDTLGYSVEEIEHGVL